MRDEEQQPDIPLKPVSLGKIEQRVKAILEHDVVIALTGGKPTAEEFRELIAALRSVLGSNIDPRVIGDSLSHLGGAKLTTEVLTREAHRLSANVHRLVQGRAVNPWRGQRADEWVIVEVVELFQRRNWKNELGEDVVFDVLSGQAAGESTRLFWSHKLMAHVARHVGFGKPWQEDTLYEQPLQFVGLRFYGLVRAKKSLDRVYFDSYRCTPQQAADNRALIRDRKRLTFQCPKKFPHPCTSCHVGYDHCPVAVHPRTYVLADCAKCGKRQWFDPEQVAAGTCLACLLAQRIAIRKR